MALFGFEMTKPISRLPGAAAWPFRMLTRIIDGEDLLFYLGVASVGYGTHELFGAYWYLVVGGLLIVHSYMPGIKETIVLLSGERKGGSK